MCQQSLRVDDRAPQIGAKGALTGLGGGSGFGSAGSGSRLSARPNASLIASPIARWKCDRSGRLPIDEIGINGDVTCKTIEQLPRGTSIVSQRRRPAPMSRRLPAIDRALRSDVGDQPAQTTVRQFIERLDGCSGAKAGRIAASFGKNRTCRSMSNVNAAALLSALPGRSSAGQGAGARPGRGDHIDPKSYSYARQSGGCEHGMHAPVANIPFIIEAWVSVADRKGDQAEIAVMANRPCIAISVCPAFSGRSRTR